MQRRENVNTPQNEENVDDDNVSTVSIRNADIV